MPALILAFFATIIVELTMAVLASRSWTGFVVLPCRQPRIRKAQEGRAQAALGMERLPAIANGEIATPSGPERQEAQARLCGVSGR
ncbi:hypothetical protein NKH49_25735 [Mesorhizobium sp. M1088]|uniref:hypothetical protein n=1 Tax=Mesorhizobium sp. M1088 TaxID=2957056 RepID=UPI00333D605A